MKNIIASVINTKEPFLPRMVSYLVFGLMSIFPAMSLSALAGGDDVKVHSDALHEGRNEGAKGLYRRRRVTVCNVQCPQQRTITLYLLYSNDRQSENTILYFIYFIG